MAGKLSPMMSHYLTVKEQYKDAIILYRLGDFYEMFFDDAKVASKILDLTLTGRDCGLDERAPMCGVPHHAVDGYIAKLIESGQSVAICEQLTAPDALRSMVERGVVRVITAGTVVEENILNEKASNYLACAYEKDNKYAVAWIDISTGEFNVCKIQGGISALDEMLGLISAAEIICCESIDLISKSLLSVKYGKLPKFKKYFESCFGYDTAKTILLSQFKTNTLQSFELENQRECVACAGALLQYLQDTQKRGLAHINKINVISQSNFLVLDTNTRRNLEICETMRDRKRRGSLINVLDKTKTNMGARNLRKWIDQPLKNEKIINLRLDSVEELTKNLTLRNALDDYFSEVKDLERLCTKIIFGSITPKDCVAIRQSLFELPRIKEALSDSSSVYLKKLYENISCEEELYDLLDKCFVDNPPALIKDGEFVKIGFSAELDYQKNLKYNGKSLIEALEIKERELTEIRTLKIGFNRVFGYYIEVSNLNKDKVPIRYVRKQTLANNERYITEELKQIEENILGADANCIAIENEIFRKVKEIIAASIPSLQQTATAIAECDCILSFAKIAIANKYCKPCISKDIESIEICEGRHPVIETLLRDNEFISNDTLLDSNKNRMLVITGPNMAGKSTYMRQTALIVLMAHIGCFVPAKSAKISITDRIFTRVGASDDLAYGQSTFMVEMVEVATILQNATEKSIVILDEIGRGTSTYDGLSIAWAVLEYVAINLKSRTLFSTHYHELAELEGMIEGVKNYKVLVNELGQHIVFLHKIARGGANKSFGIEVASLAGVPSKVIARAKEIAAQLETARGDRDTNSLMLNAMSPKNNNSSQMSFLTCNVANEVLTILKDTNIDNLTPVQAFMLLAELKEKAKKE